MGRGARRRDGVHRVAEASARSRAEVRVRDLGAEQFVLHHLCSTTAETVLRLFEQNGARCRIVAELWSFENIKSFVQEEVGMAFVPGITVRQELRDGTLVRIPLRELAMPRRTLMIYREQGYLSDTARELIKIVRAFNWDQGFRRQGAGPPARRLPSHRARRTLRPAAVTRHCPIDCHLSRFRSSDEECCNFCDRDERSRVLDLPRRGWLTQTPPAVPRPQTRGGTAGSPWRPDDGGRADAGARSAAPTRDAARSRRSSIRGAILIDGSGAPPVGPVDIVVDRQPHRRPCAAPARRACRFAADARRRIPTSRSTPPACT